MKKQVNMIHWMKAAAMVTGIPLIISCQSSVYSHSTIQHMECDILEGAEGNKKVHSCPPILPVEISQQMVPSNFCPSVQELPSIEKRFDVFAEQVPARLFFLSLVKDTPYNVNVHPGVTGMISVQLKKVSIPEVLGSIRNVYGYDFKRANRTIEIFPATLQTRTFKINYLDVKRGGESDIQVTAGGLKSGTGTTTTGSISGIASTTTTASGSTETRNSQIKTNTKSDFWEELKKSLEAIVGEAEGRRVAVSPMSGLVVVQAMPTELRKVAEFLRNAQLTLNRQVILEAKILEVSLNDSFQAGINWALLTGGLQATHFGGQVVQKPINFEGGFPTLNTNLVPPINFSPGLPPFNSATNAGAFGGVFTLALGSEHLGTFMELLSAQGRVQVLSSPRISTMNNQKALFKAGKDSFFITNVSTTQTSVTGGSVIPTQNVTFDNFFSGIALDVTPSINECDEVTLHIHPMVSVVTDDPKTYTLNSGTTAQTSTVPLASSTIRESDSVVRAKSGQMVVIGGLMQDQTAKVKEGIPILKDLPLLGSLFTHQVEQKKKSELVILLKPIVTDDVVWQEETCDALDRIETLDTPECN